MIRLLSLLRLLPVLFALSGAAWGQRIDNPPGIAVGTAILGNAINVTQAPYNATANVSANWSATNAANTTAIQAAITAAQSAGVPVYLPAPKTAGACYNYTGGGVAISGNLSVVGDEVSGNWPGSSQIDVPSGTPPLLGSVLCPTANGQDAIDISGTALTVNFSNIGIYFQIQFGNSSTTTGDGIHYVPTSTNQGLTGSYWVNVLIFGHDGNHYAVNLQNPILDTFEQLQGHGGGLIKLYANAGEYGNLVFVHPYGNVLVGGAANGFNIDASSFSFLNLMTFIRPQVNVNNITLTPSGNPPTSSQYIFYAGANIAGIKLVGPDLETNVSSNIQIPVSGHQNSMDWEGLFTDAGNVYASAWGLNGVHYNPTTHAFTDTTSSGSVAGVTTLNSFATDHVAALNSTTYAVLTTLLLAPPVPGPNVSASRLDALYATGEIYTTSDIGTGGGAYFSGGGSWGGNVTLSGQITASGLATSGIIAGSLCATSAGLILYEAAVNCYPATGSQSPQTIAFMPGAQVAVSSVPGGFAKVTKASTVDAFVVTALALSCATAPTVTMYECGTSTTCAAPTTIASVQVTAAGTATPATVSSSAITAGDYVAFEETGGVCAGGLNVSAQASVHAN